ncbi:DNA cytosine methyltransferase [Jeotgalibaca porci]|uniref:DNA cytosine methyltransferase n=1 Tax=Jeotgalibaca porci TaxID=1868793 RepID=UPI00359F8241
MKLRVLENFAGIGTQRMALENLGIDHEVVGITEIDKFAIKSYEAIHGKVNNLGDISLIDPNDVPDHDLFTYSFPCQDISVAGKGKGFEKGSGTRSGLLWECEKVIRAKKPKYLLMENVKNLVSKKFKPGFEEWLTALEDMGYTNYWQVLNAKDYGVPQNRERVFCVSILGGHEPYKFPEKETLELRLKDILEHEVDEKFYLDNDKAKQLIATVSNKYDIKETTPTDGGLKLPRPKEVANTILARYDAGISNQQSTGTMVIEPKAERIGGIFDKDGKRHQAGAVWDKEQLAPTLDTMKGGWRQPSVLIKNNTKQGYIEATDGDGVDLSFPTSNTRRGRVQKEKSQTLDTSDSKGVIEKMRIRKLTPKECWRLMGISDEDFEKAQEVNSNTQLYKQAGNAIVVDVLEAIFANLFKQEELK